jgi:methylase of polypeptide subunit release factors
MTIESTMLNKVSYIKKSLLNGGYPVFYNSLYDGGGTTIGYDMCKHSKVLEQITDVTSTLEICSGPGFIGYYLLFNNLTTNLYLSDKFDGVREGIKKTNQVNDVNVQFINSNCFQNFPSDLKFDLIIGNPPHFKENNEWISNKKTKEEIDASYRINLDINLNFHIDFFHNAVNFLNPNGKIIFVENETFISNLTLRKLGGDLYEYEVIDNLYTENKLYYIICKLR